MDKVKRLVGIVAGLFCTLVVAGLCSVCCKPDLNWLISLNKPTYVPGSFVFNLLVAITDISTIAVISKLVVGRHIFPSMLIFALLGVFTILSVYFFFTLKLLFMSLITVGLMFACSFLLLIRFMKKDPKTALAYLPAFMFNCYLFITVLALAMHN